MRLALLPFLTLALAAQTPAPEAPKQAAAPQAIPAPVEKPKEDTILARINGKAIMTSDFDTYLAQAYNDQQRLQIQMVAGAMQQIQDQFLQTKILEAKARKEKLDQTPAFQQRRNLMEMDILVRSLFDRDGEELRKKLVITDENVKAFYDGHLAKFKTPESFDARHILIGLKGSPAAGDSGLTEEDAKAKLAKLQAELKAGKKLEDLAKDYSDDPGSKDKGGLYTNTAFGSFAPEFEDAVRKQAVGQVGEPVKTMYGYHLIQVEKITPAQQQTFEEVKDKARQLATQERQEQIMSEYLDAAKKEVSYLDGDAAKAAPATETTQPKKSAKKTHKGASK